MMMSNNQTIFSAHVKCNPLSFRRYISPCVNFLPLSRVSTIRCASAAQRQSSNSTIEKASSKQHPSSHFVDPQVKIVTKKPIKYALVDAFTDEPFKGNPAAVCLLEEDINKRDCKWFIGVAREYNAPMTCFLSPICNCDDDHDYNNNQFKEGGKKSNPTFSIRWFTTLVEVPLCGHATLAAAHYLFTSGLVKTNLIEFVGLSGTLTAKRIPSYRNRNILDESKFLNNGHNISVEHDREDQSQKDISIELNFPTTTLVECAPQDVPFIPFTLNGASVLNVMKTASSGDVLIEVSSGQSVADLKPDLRELQAWKGGRIILITGKAPEGSGFDFISRVFGPNIGVNEDPVCGSAHCALAPYWCPKLGKTDFLAYMASPRGGVLDLHFEEENQRLKIRGKAFTVMEGSLFA